MLAQLLTLKARLGLEAFDPTDDAGLNNLIKMVSARFAAECNRIFDYGAGVMFEFRGDEMNIMVDPPAIEHVSKFESKASEGKGWVELPNIDYFLSPKKVVIELT